MKKLASIILIVLIGSTLTTSLIVIKANNDYQKNVTIKDLEKEINEVSTIAEERMEQIEKLQDSIWKLKK